MSENQPNRPNWVDKASLASNVIQNVQLHELQSAMRALGALHAGKLQLELNDLETREREDRLRESIWQMERAFSRIVAEATPSAICAVAQAD